VPPADKSIVAVTGLGPLANTVTGMVTRLRGCRR
jgi:hypothetical protein